MSSRSVLMAVCGAGALTGALLLRGGIRALRRGLGAREIAALPVRSEQKVAFDAPGEILLGLRGRQFRTGLGGLSFVLRDPLTGTEVPGRPVIARSKVATMSGVVTLSVHRFALPRAGPFVLTVAGMSESADHSDAKLVLERAGAFALAIRILWVLGAAIALIVSLVFALLAFNGVTGGS